MEKEWDVFISHAREDKAFVSLLAQAMAQLGVKVWYDDFSLEPGSSLAASIDKGIAGSRFGLVVVSQAFVSKEWTQRELQGLVAGKVSGEVRIVPIWLDVSHEIVFRFSPSLADTVPINATGMAADQVLLRVLKIVRPDIYFSLPREQLQKKMQGEALQRLQRELGTIKDELREIIAAEITKVVKLMYTRALNR
jgi:hypothetical protein